MSKWSTHARNWRTWENFAAEQTLLSEREVHRGNEEVAAIHDYAATVARNEAQHEILVLEGYREVARSTHVPGAGAVAEIAWRTVPTPAADTSSVIERGYELYYGSSDLEPPDTSE